MVHACNPSTQEAKRLLDTKGIYPRLHIRGSYLTMKSREGKEGEGKKGGRQGRGGRPGRERGLYKFGGGRNIWVHTSNKNCQEVDQNICVK